MNRNFLLIILVLSLLFVIMLMLGYSEGYIAAARQCNSYFTKYLEENICILK